MGVKRILRHIRHLSRRRRNRVLAVLAFLNAALLFLVYSNLVAYPNTFLGATNISGKTARQITELIKKQEAVQPKLQVKNRTYTYSYTQLGVVIDSKRAVTEIFTPNRGIFPLNLLAFFQSIGAKRVLPPPLMFTQEFDQFVGDMIFDFGQGADTVSVDPTTKSLLFEERSDVYRFDRTSLTALLISNFGEYGRPIYPMLAKITNETIDQVTDLNQKLGTVFAEPMMVYLDLGGTTEAVELKEEDIREATTVTLDADQIHVSVSVNPEALNRVLTRRVRQAGFPIRDTIVTPTVQEDFARAVTLRFGGVSVAAVVTRLDDGPNTNGSLAAKYIEVDISQQKMYLFKGSKVYKTYKVSTGSDYPTPVGKFAILNKTGLGFSTIYNVWLPWWMGFAYSDELNAYFGIHEQPYILTQDGKPVIADARPIGTPSTGGCVALAPGAAREVYAFADIGTPVYIYN